MEPALKAPAAAAQTSAPGASTSPPAPIPAAPGVPAAPASSPAQPAPAPETAHVLLPAFRPRVLALIKASNKGGKVLIKLAAPAPLATPAPSPPSSSSLLWQRHAHGSYRSYYGARRQASASSTGIAAAAATITTTTGTTHPSAPSKSTPITDARLSLLQPEWFTNKDCLDIGTNTGKVAWEIYTLFKPKRMVGIDIDPELIQVGKEKLAWACRREGGRKGHAERVEFRCEDFVGVRKRRSRKEGEGGMEGKNGGREDDRDAGVEGDEAGKEDGKEQRGQCEIEKAAEEAKNEEMDEEEVEGAENYDIITCFSVTKHIHLQGGDAALRRLFHRVYAHLRPGGRFILEPQAWRTYRKRKHASVESQSNYALLQLRPPFRVLLKEVGFESLEDLGVPPDAPAGLHPCPGGRTKRPSIINFMVPRSILLPLLSFCCFFVALVQAKPASVRGGLPTFEDAATAGVAVSDAPVAVGDDPWQAVTDAINNYHMTDFAVVVTNASGIQYLYEKGNISYTDTVMNVASTTKWVSGTMIMRVVASGALKLNDYCHTFFPWWTRNPNDPRSRIQLKHLLSFTSGYYQLTYGSSVPCFRNSTMDYVACVRELYETIELRWEPGTVWDYSSLHLKIAGGLAVAASGKSIRVLLDETLAELGMTNSYYDMDQNPELAGSLYTTGEDYNKFLESLYFHRILPAEIVKEMESDHTPSPVVSASYKSWGLGMAVGHYSYTNWLECVGSLPEPQPLRPECYEKSIHTSPGVFGYWPLIDRFNNYWMQIVYNGPAVIGCIDGWVARGVIKPVVDGVMGDEKIIPARKFDVEAEKQRLRELLDLDALAQWPN